MNPSRLARVWLAGGLALAAMALVWIGGRALDKWSLDRPSADALLHPTSATGSVAQKPHSRKTAARSNPALTTTAVDRLLQRLGRHSRDISALRNEALLKFKSPQALRDFLRGAARHKLTVLGRLDGLLAVRVGYDNLERLRDLIGEDAEAYEDIGANFVVRVPDWPNPEDRPGGSGTTSFDGDGFLPAIGANGDRAGWGQGVVVAVVDSGVEHHATFGDGQITHVDLVNDGEPFYGHGTAMASLIAGQDDWAPGVAPASHILDVRVMDSDGYGTSYTIAEGIVHAADAGAQVINVSLCTYGDATIVRDAVAYAQNKGAVVVAAAGNDQTSNMLAFPAAIDSVVAVGGVDAKHQQAYFSNSGKGLDVTAPAVGIQSAYGKQLVVLGDGTSQAAAITSGVLAAAISRGATTPSAASSWLKANALPLGLPPERGGSGMVQTGKH
jgi:thermitase